MVEVFKTNVQEPGASTMLIRKLLVQFPQNRINFDLEDCDRILRIEGQEIFPGAIMGILAESGYHCEVLL
jgi:hypothetical protein